MSPDPARQSVDRAADGGRVLPFDRDASQRSIRVAWAATSVPRRLAVVRRLRHLIADHVDRLVDTVRLPQRQSRAETLAAEILPLADACRFLEREAAALLAPRRLGRRGRPFWLVGSEVEIRREPVGLVLIIGPSNYPLLLPGVQLVQALVAGNGVQLKPGHDGLESALLLVELLEEAGLPSGLVTVLDESPRAAIEAIQAGVDKVVLTGSLATGKAVLRQLAESVTPAVMELSGCDAVFVRRDAELDLVVNALRFGLTFNSSFTCIAPRRVFVDRQRLPDLEARLKARIADVAPLHIHPESVAEVRRLVTLAVEDGARIVCGGLPKDSSETSDARQGSMRPLVLADARPGMAILEADLAAPVLSLVPVDSDEQALEIARQGRYRLGTTIFGDAREARDLAYAVPAGVVVINDLIVPTADPRLPFGGRRASGYGVTRGAEGLLELTQLKTVVSRRGRFRPHLESTGVNEERLLGLFVQVAHAPTFGRRLRAMFEIVKLMAREGRG